MKLRYDPETDSLYIDLKNLPGIVTVNSREVSDGVVLDFDSSNHLAGIEVERASRTVDLSHLEIEALPTSKLSLTGLQGEKMQRGLIHSNSEIMMGKPVVAGTRITAEHILKMLGAGETVEQILDSYPSLTVESIHAALAFAAEVLQAEWAVQHGDGK